VAHVVLRSIMVMRFVGLTIIAPLAACYSPDLGDCTVACVRSADCIAGQVCGEGAFCAAPGVSCAVVSDADVDVDVQSNGDVDALPVDAPPPGQLEVEITDRGRVVIDGVGTCDPEAAEQCRFSAPRGVPLTLRAIPYPGRRFDKWDSSACGGQGPTCHLTLTLPVTEVHARFHKD